MPLSTNKTPPPEPIPLSFEQSGDRLQNPDDIVFRVDETSDLPIWAQLRNRIAYLIRTGRFAPGEQLPSVRSLAADAHINYNTVSKAYRDLELSGMIVSVRGCGMFVQKHISTNDTQDEAIDALLESCIRQYRTRGMSYQDVLEHVSSVINKLAIRTREAEEEKQNYGKA